ncbi:MAG: hypothetical protein L0191_09835 [Acidobacteria bacterium]|nr:hypothetical protein [Acidobacteriota bacterium]
MTQYEIETVKTAIRQLMSDEPDGFTLAVEGLCRLVGWRWPSAELARKVKSVPVERIARGPDQPFQVPIEKGTPV